MRVAPASNLTLERVSGEKSLKAVKEGNKVLVGSCKEHTPGSLFLPFFIKYRSYAGRGGFNYTLSIIMPSYPA